MRGLTKVAALSTALLVAACGKQAATTAEGGLDAALQRDLALASAQGVELAKHGQALPQASQVVSAVEQLPQKRRIAAAPRRAAASVPEPQPEEVKVGNEPAQTLEVETAVAAQTAELPQPVQTTVPEPAPVPVPEPTAGPAPLPMPSNDGGYGEGDHGARGRGGWGGIGVVIRGGSAGDDHCDPRHDGRRRGGVLINTRMPGGGGMVPTGTFPGGGGRGVFRIRR